MNTERRLLKDPSEEKLHKGENNRADGTSEREGLNDRFK